MTYLGKKKLNGLEINNVSFSYLNRMVLQDISITVNGGEMIGLLGPNGSGKTTLLKLTSGVLKPGSGEVLFEKNNIKGLSRKNIARRMAVVPQQFNVPSTFMVHEVVMLGRTPFLKPFGKESKVDRRLAFDAMETVGIENLQTRRFEELSGGEKQKVVLAMALAQQPEILLLDEPTLHLDINHQVHILDLVTRLNNTKGITVIAALHDLNLASLYFKRLLLLDMGKLISDGTPAEVIKQENIEKVYGMVIDVTLNPLTGIPYVVINPKNDLKS
jgi:iron complex transport system ATP-binding protein